jgi:hypothetical protein
MRILRDKTLAEMTKKAWEQGLKTGNDSGYLKGYQQCMRNQTQVKIEQQVEEIIKKENFGG